MTKTQPRYVERMPITEARELAQHLNIPLIALLDASICLIENGAHGNTKCFSDHAELDNLDIPITV